MREGGEERGEQVRKLDVGRQGGGLGDGLDG